MTLFDLNSALRLLLYGVATFLMLYDFGLIRELSVISFLIFVVVLGISNAFNFMDGVNGMCVLYCLVTLFSIEALAVQSNVDILHSMGDIFYSLHVVSWVLIVLLFFNFRKSGSALAFIGDAGSIPLGLFCGSLVVLLIYLTGEFSYIILLLVYGVDTVGTILFRLLKRENIFAAHRLHIYQKLANEKQWGHLKVSVSYAVLQLCINLSLMLALKADIHLMPLSLIWCGLIFALYLLIRKFYISDL